MFLGDVVKKIKLIDIAHGRSGDKGNNSNIGVIARSEADYKILEKFLTAEVVANHLSEFCSGEVTRYELPNIGAVNFVLTSALGGGGTISLRTDSQGKTLAAALLRLELEIP